MQIGPVPTVGRRTDHERWWAATEGEARRCAQESFDIVVDGELATQAENLEDWLVRGKLPATQVDLRFLISEPQGSDISGKLLSKILVVGVAWFDLLSLRRQLSWSIDWNRRSVDYRVPCAEGVLEVPVNLFAVLANVCRARKSGRDLHVAGLTRKWLA